jgi:hypothetical protein
MIEMEGSDMKTRKLLLPILLMVLAPVLFGGCYTMISQTVYARPEAQIPERAVNMPVRDRNSSQEDSLAADTGEEQKDYAQIDDNRYDYPNDFNGPYGMPGPYPYDSWRYRPGFYGSYIWDPYIYTPHLHFGLLFNSGDPFYWHDPWFFGYNSWNDSFYYDPWYSPYYSLYDPWYDSYYGSYYYGGGYDYYHRYHGGRGGGIYGHRDGFALGPRIVRQDRLAGFGAYANTRGVYAPDNSVTGNTADRTGGAVQINRRTAGAGSVMINTRRNSSTEVIGKTTAGTITPQENSTPARENPLVRQRTRQGEMTRRVSDSESYIMTIPNDNSGRPVVQYRDPQVQLTDPKDIKITREDEPVQANQPAVSENRRQDQNMAQRRRSGETQAAQPRNDNTSQPAQNTERAVTRPAPTQNDTPSERVNTSRSNTPSRDTGRSTPSYTPSNRGNSTPSYTPRSGGGSSSGGQSRNTSSRSGGRRR